MAKQLISKLSGVGHGKKGGTSSKSYVYDLATNRDQGVVFSSIGETSKLFFTLSDSKSKVALEQIRSTDFGRNIKTHIKKLSTKPEGIVITLSNKPAAVVLRTDDYNQLITIRDKYKLLMDAKRETELSALRNEFEDLIELMKTKKSREAMRNMIHVTGEDLASTYQPGRTEKH